MFSLRLTQTESLSMYEIKNEKVMTENLSQLNALVLITEPP